MNASRRRVLQAAAVSVLVPGLSHCGPAKTPASGVPRSAFDAHSTAEEVTAGLDLKGRIAVVTGCTSGIGFETMRVLALRGAYVLGTSRSIDRAADACRRVAGVTTPLQLDLADPESVVACAGRILSLRAPVDYLVCNAGYRGGDGERRLAYGVERHFAVNHLGHFLLVNRVLDALYFAWQGRVVVVASRAAYRDAPPAGIRFDDLTLKNNYSDREAYGHSKLANVLFSCGLAQRLRGTRITSNSLHPGVVDTAIDRNLGSAAQWLFSAYTRLAGKSIEQGAATSCFVATSPILGSTSGEYFEDCNAVSVAGSRQYDTMMADRLWAVSAELLKDWTISHDTPDPEQFENGWRRRRQPDADG
jgi:NAD(P)-dependent dehydrogenase (short-subunit alcohol dehydrogenase family)